MNQHEQKIAYNVEGNTFTLCIPVERMNLGQNSRQSSILLLFLTGAGMASYAVVPFVLWLLQNMLSEILSDAVLTRINAIFYECIPELVSTLVLLHVTVCLGYVLWHYYYHYQ